MRSIYKIEKFIVERPISLFVQLFLKNHNRPRYALITSLSKFIFKKERAMTRRDIQILQSQQEYPSVSITVALVKTMPERKNNVTKVRNAVASAKKRLLQEFSERDIQPILDKLQVQVDGIDFTQINAQGLALFANKHVAARYELLFTVPDRVVVDAIFEVRNVLWALNRMSKYWVLALSEKPTRLFHGANDSLHEIIEPAQDEFGVDQDGFPYTYVRPELEKSFHIDSGTGTVVNLDGSLDAHKKKFIEYMFKLADRFFKAEPLPLVVIADEKNYSIFKDASHGYPVAVFVHGDYCKRNAHGISEAVWPEVQKYVDEQIEHKVAEFVEGKMGQAHQAQGFEKIWQLAHEGRVHELLVEEGYTVKGFFNPESASYILLADAKTVPGEAVDLVNDLIETVLSKGDAKITFCKQGSLERFEHVAAILRY